jgi:hypothetical protein
MNFIQGGSGENKEVSVYMQLLVEQETRDKRER